MALPIPPLPELFKTIIDHDKTAPDLKAPVVSLCALREHRKRKWELVNAAEKYVTRQRKGD